MTKCVESRSASACLLCALLIGCSSAHAQEGTPSDHKPLSVTPQSTNNRDDTKKLIQQVQSVARAISGSLAGTKYETYAQLDGDLLSITQDSGQSKEALEQVTLVAHAVSTRVDFLKTGFSDSSFGSVVRQWIASPSSFERADVNAMVSAGDITLLLVFDATRCDGPSLFPISRIELVRAALLLNRACCLWQPLSVVQKRNARLAMSLQWIEQALAAGYFDETESVNLQTLLCELQELNLMDSVLLAERARAVELIAESEDDELSTRDQLALADRYYSRVRDLWRLPVGQRFELLRNGEAERRINADERLNLQIEDQLPSVLINIRSWMAWDSIRTRAAGLSLSIARARYESHAGKGLEVIDELDGFTPCDVMDVTSSRRFQLRTTDSGHILYAFGFSGIDNDGAMLHAEQDRYAALQFDHPNVCSIDWVPMKVQFRK